MDTLYFLLLIAMLVYSAYSYISYSNRRSSDKASSREAEKQLVFHRKLTEEECELLDRLEKKKGVQKRIGDEVYLIKGKFDRHGITVNHNTIWHNFIGGLEVTLDDRGLNYTQDYNIAEVVKTKKQPVVMNFNNIFSLVGIHKAETRLEKGEIGNFSEKEEIGEEGIKLIANRKQTQEEIEGLEMLSAGLTGVFTMMTAFLILSFCFFLGKYAQWAGWLGFFLFAYSIWRIWREPRLPKAAPVRCLRGKPEILAQFQKDDGTIQSVVARMGDLELTYDRNWLPFMAELSGKTTEVELTEDRRLLRFGPHLSVAEEERQFPSNSYFRHMGMAILSVIVLISCLFFTFDLSTSLPQSLSWLQGGMSYQSFAVALSEHLASSFIFATSLVFLVVHTPLAINGYRDEKERDENIKRYYSNMIL